MMITILGQDITNFYVSLLISLATQCLSKVRSLNMFDHYFCNINKYPYIYTMIIKLVQNNVYNISAIILQTTNNKQGTIGARLLNDMVTFSNSPHPFFLSIVSSSCFFHNRFRANCLAHFFIVAHLPKKFSFHFSVNTSNKRICNLSKN